MSQSIIRVLNQGAQKTSLQLVKGQCFVLKYFCIGAGGHDPATGLPVVPDPTLTELPIPKFTDLKAITSNGGSANIVGPRVIEFNLVLIPGIATGEMSSVGLYGEITSVADPADIALVGQTFLHSIANFSLQNKLDSETKTITLRLNNV